MSNAAADINAKAAEAVAAIEEGDYSTALRKLRAAAGTTGGKHTIGHAARRGALWHQTRRRESEIIVTCREKKAPAGPK